MKKPHFFAFIPFISLFFIACSNDKRSEAQKIVFEWTGKEINFPSQLRCTSMGNDTACVNVYNKAYKILLYVDSTGCTSCRLKFPEWDKIIAESISFSENQPDFLFFFQPKQKDEKYLSHLFRQDEFIHPVFIDMGNEINGLNKFPSKDEYQCFLLDSENKVLFVGNPTYSPRIWELYKQQITGEKAQEPINLTQLQAAVTRKEIPEMRVGETYTCSFEIENVGSHPYIIWDIKSSCGCTVPSWENQPIVPGSKTKIEVQITPDTDGFFNKTINVYGNAENSPLKLTITGMVK